MGKLNIFNGHKELIVQHYLESIGEAILMPGLEVRIKRVPKSSRHYFLYWIDGQIERRETYGIHENKAVLYLCEKRYAPNERWINEP